MDRQLTEKLREIPCEVLQILIAFHMAKNSACPQKYSIDEGGDMVAMAELIAHHPSTPYAVVRRIFGAKARKTINALVEEKYLFKVPPRGEEKESETNPGYYFNEDFARQILEGVHFLSDGLCPLDYLCEWGDPLNS